jgi:hypothetical protein
MLDHALNAGIELVVVAVVALLTPVQVALTIAAADLDAGVELEAFRIEARVAGRARVLVVAANNTRPIVAQRARRQSEHSDANDET